MSEVTKTIEFKQKQQLSIAQENAIDLLILGKTDEEVGQIIGVGRPTIWVWRHKNSRFQTELVRRRQELWGSVLGQVRGLAQRSVEVLAQKLEKGSLRAATIVLRILDIGRCIQEARETERKEEFLNQMEAEIEGFRQALVSYRERKEAEGSLRELTQARPLQSE